jgi:hypothetical protein
MTLLTKTAFLENSMLRLLKALPLTLALAALSFFSISCGSSNSTQIRVINAIPDADGNLDVDFNGNKITGSTPMSFGSIFPTTNPPATYTGVSSGSGTITAYVTGTTTNPVNNGTSSFNGSTQYTVVLDGFARNNNSPAVLIDNNTAPTSGSQIIRVIDASAFTPGGGQGQGGFDVYITPPGGDTTGITPQTIGLGQATTYQSMTNGNYNLVVVPHGGQIPIINWGIGEADGTVRTLVIVDNSGGGSGPAPAPELFTDVN